MSPDTGVIFFKFNDIYFFFIALVFMYFGRKMGWAFSRSVLYSAPLVVTILLCVLWGIAIAVAIRSLIVSVEPGIVIRWIMGYALGSYVAIPNFGLIAEGTIPPHAQKRHMIISNLPVLVYISASIGFAS